MEGHAPRMLQDRQRCTYHKRELLEDGNDGGSRLNINRRKSGEGEEKEIYDHITIYRIHVS